MSITPFFHVYHKYVFNMDNISKIKISGTSYSIKDENACKVVELTQAQYDALPASAKTSNSLFVITDAQGADLSNYYTKSETSGATEISTALNAKADTLVSGTNIKTINNESILGSGNIEIQGGGASYTAGDGIDITNDVISVTGKVDTSTYNTYTAATATAIGDKLAVSDFNTYSGTVNTAINSKASQSDLSTLSGTVTAHTANTDIHVTTAQTAAWDAKSDFSGSYNDLTDKPTIPTVPTSNTAFTNDAGYITSDAISGKADTSAVTESINAAVSGKVDTSTFNTYSGSVETALNAKADTATTYTKTEVDNAITAATSTKQDTLVSGTNIKTINNESLLGSGNINIQGGGGIDSGTVQTMIDNSLSGYVYTADNGKQDIFGSKTFVGNKRITFTQRVSNDKLGFTLYDTRDEQGKAKEFGAFELNPTGITENSVTHPLLTLNHYRSNNGRDAQTYIGYRQYDYQYSAAYNLLAPLPENAKTPFGLTTNFQNFYMPLGIKVDNSTMVKADSGGVMDISSYIGGGGGKAVSAGTNISVTTGETADTINCTLPITVIQNSANSLKLSDNSTYINFANYSLTEGYKGGIDDSSHYSHKEGYYSKIENYCQGSHVEGWYCEIKYNSKYSHAEGYYTRTTNESEHSSGRYNVSNKANSTFGDSGNTLFSVGNGTADNARHNAFEIRQNGDIYYFDGTNDVKLQDKFSSLDATIGSINTILESI